MRGNKPHLKHIGTDRILTVSEETGELLDVEIKKQKILVTTKEQFFQIYMSYMDELFDLSPVEFMVFAWIASKTDFDEGSIGLNSYQRQSCSDSTKLSVKTINNTICNLTKKQFLLKIGTPRSGQYIINPKYAWKGNSATRAKSLKFVLEVEYNETH